MHKINPCGDSNASAKISETYLWLNLETWNKYTIVYFLSVSYHITKFIHYYYTYRLPIHNRKLHACFGWEWHAFSFQFLCIISSLISCDDWIVSHDNPSSWVKKKKISYRQSKETNFISKLRTNMSWRFKQTQSFDCDA